MITKQRVMEILAEVVYSPGAFDKANLEKAVDKIFSESSWKRMDTAPRDIPVLVWAYSSAEWWKFNMRQRTCFPVEWDNVWDRWIVLGGADDGDGQPFIALDPIAWMELPEYDN